MPERPVDPALSTGPVSAPTASVAAIRRVAYQKFARAHGYVLLRTNGRPRRLGWNQYALVLETVGRRSGAVRAVPLLYLPDGDDFVVLASNYGQERPPAWWFNLQARPDAAVRWSGRRLTVRARLLTGDERDATVERGRDYNKQWQAYFENVRRELPVVKLERTEG